jgi:peptidoglycan hydrolase-like protein with peptidoglycan-binding domain
MLLASLLIMQGTAAQNTAAAKKHAPASKASKAKVIKKVPTARKTAPKATAKRSTASRPAAKTTSKTARRSSKRAPKRVVARRSVQQQPTPSRYKEIQQALADRGYFRGDPDGNWGAESVDALKRFQHDQNLTEDGKIGALSLIALGLGPQRVAATDHSPQAQ